MSDIKINRQTGQIAVPNPGGGYKIYEKGQYKQNPQTGQYAVPSSDGKWAIYDAPKVAETPEPPQERSLGQDLLRQVGLGTRYTLQGMATLPAMIGDAANSTVNLGIKGVNEVAGTEIPYLQMPTDILAQPGPFPSPETTTERIVAEPSKFIASIPTFGGVGKMAAKYGGELMAPLATLGENLGIQAAGALGGGGAYGVAKEVAPNSPGVQLAAALLGGAAAGAGANAIANRLGGTAEAAVPATSDLKAAAQAAYQQADDAGAIVRPETIQKLGAQVQKDLAEFGYHPNLQPRIATVLSEIDRISQQPITTGGIQVLRRIAGNAAMSTDPSERAAAAKVIGQIDDMLANLTPDDVIQGNGQVASEALKNASRLWAQFRKSETIETAVENARRNAESAGSGGNVENATRQAIKSILNSSTKRRGFNKAEIDAMEKIVSGGSVQNFARLIGKLSPSGNGLMAALGLGAVSTGGPLGLAPVAGLVAKPIATQMAKSNVDKLLQIIRAGQQPVTLPPMPELPPSLMGVLPTLPGVQK